MSQLKELSWIAIARTHIGEREIKGIRHNAKIVGWWSAINAGWFSDDETPWCGAYVGGVLAADGKPIPKNAARALSWENYGVKLNAPAYGCIAVKKRNGGGHVCFVVGQDMFGNLMCLGGNQDDEVKISPYKRTAFHAFRWPSIYPSDERFNLPVLHSDGRLVRSEA